MVAIGLGLLALGTLCGYGVRSVIEDDRKKHRPRRPMTLPFECEVTSELIIIDMRDESRPQVWM